MASPAHQLANAANAQLSRQGAICPKTRTNTASPPSREFEALRSDYQTEIGPRGPFQRTLFNEMVAAAWNLLRIRRMETELCSTAKSYSELIDNAGIQTKLDRLARPHTRIERTFHRCLREWKALQTNDAITLMLVDTSIPFLPRLASTKEIAKRTQPAFVAAPAPPAPSPG